MGTRIGIDIGGTFTDLVFMNPQGEVRRAKVLSTPDDYSQGIANGLGGALADGGLRIGDITQIMHGTTVATNALLEGKGAKVALITTEGFRDVLEIRRLRMPVLYDIRWRKPPALVPRRRRFEVNERIDHRGVVERPLDEDDARAVIDRLLATGADAIAICLINGYANGVHEARLRELIRERDADISITLSSELLPEIREYERTSTTVVNAYVLPLVRHYLRGLADKLRERAIARPLTIMQSSGGAMSASAAAERPIHIIESGPAAGVVGAAELARRLGNLSLLSFDMGGTTAKAALIDAGQFLRVNSLEVGGGINIAGRLLTGGGYHVRAPAIDIAEVGAGGGSLARLDAGGALRVGPDSAGAMPGPACYAQGGSSATVTDANIVLGFINPAALAGGGLPLRRDLAERALDADVAAPLGLPLAEAAWGVHRVANATMARALRAVSTERGRDPRDLYMLAFGGNGPVHAATLARLLDIRRILVPPVPGLFSALGMLFPEIEHHYVRARKERLDRLDAGGDRGIVPRPRERRRRIARCRRLRQRRASIRTPGGPALCRRQLRADAALSGRSLRELAARTVLAPARTAVRLQLRYGGDRDDEHAGDRARLRGLGNRARTVVLCDVRRGSRRIARRVLRAAIRDGVDAGNSAYGPRGRVARGAVAGRGVRQHHGGSAGWPCAAHRLGHDRNRTRVMR